MVDRKKRLKPWAAGAALASILLLGGCLRFGPQEDEMANTTNTETAQTQQAESADSQPAEEAEDSVADESAAESTESTESGQTEPSGDEESTEGTTSSASEEEKKSKDEGQRIEVTISRDDAEQLVEFDLHVLPAGYSLSGMSWEPEAEARASIDPGEDEAAGTGTTTDNEGTTTMNEAMAGTDAEIEEGAAPTTEPERITSTYLDAVIAGQMGTEGFFIDENGQRIGYRYAADQTGRTGTVRLDFRDGDGGIATWEARIALGLQEITDPAEEADGGQE